MVDWTNMVFWTNIVFSTYDIHSMYDESCIVILVTYTLSHEARAEDFSERVGIL